MLYQELRPKVLEEFIGNEDVVASVRSLIASPDPPCTYLFSGPSGCGKTTLARILAKGLDCQGDFGVIEVNAANTRGIDSVREIVETAGLRPLSGNSKAYIVDESHQLSWAAQQAFLKTIEEPPSGVYFMFCSTEPGRIIETIRNRCTQYVLKPLRDREARILVERAVRLKGYRVDEDVLSAVVASAAGCPRTLLVLLEQVAAAPDVKTAAALASRGLDAEIGGIELCRAVASSAPARWKEIARILKGLKESEADPDGLRRSMLGYLQSCMLGAKSHEAAKRYGAMIEVLAGATREGGLPHVAALAMSLSEL